MNYCLPHEKCIEELLKGFFCFLVQNIIDLLSLKFEEIGKCLLGLFVLSFLLFFVLRFQRKIGLGILEVVLQVIVAHLQGLEAEDVMDLVLLLPEFL